jgi:hypothetical protein
MVGEPLNPTLPEPRRFSIWVPRPLWISVAALCIGVAVGGLAWPIVQQEMAVRNLLHRRSFVKTIDCRPSWLRDWLGDVRVRGFDEVEQVVIIFDEPVRFDDSDMRQIEALRGLRTLSLEYTGVSDAGLVHLKGLTKLERLWLDNTQVTDVGLTRLKGLTGLRELDLRNTGVSDQGIAELKHALPGRTIEK